MQAKDGYNWKPTGSEWLDKDAQDLIHNGEHQSVEEWWVDGSCSLPRVQPQNSEAVPAGKWELQSPARDDLPFAAYRSLILLFAVVGRCSWPVYKQKSRRRSTHQCVWSGASFLILWACLCKTEMVQAKLEVHDSLGEIFSLREERTWQGAPHFPMEVSVFIHPSLFT